MRYKINRYSYAVARPVSCIVIDHTGEKEIHPIGWHSNEFEYGYGGSGPAELALAILVDYFDERMGPSDIRWASQAWALHFDFKRQIIAVHQEEEFEIDEMEVALFCFAEVSA